jgi:hypothetical protein
MESELVRESRLRRILRKRGFRLLKTPARSALRRYQPVGYALLRLETNTHIMGDLA